MIGFNRQSLTVLSVSARNTTRVSLILRWLGAAEWKTWWNQHVLHFHMLPDDWPLQGRTAIPSLSTTICNLACGLHGVKRHKAAKGRKTDKGWRRAFWTLGNCGRIFFRSSSQVIVGITILGPTLLWSYQKSPSIRKGRLKKWILHREDNWVSCQLLLRSLGSLIKGGARWWSARLLSRGRQV